MKKATAVILLDKRRALKDGAYPVKLRVTYQRQQKYYPVPCSIAETYSLPNNYVFTEDEFEKTQTQKPRGMYKDIQTDLKEFQVFASGIIKKMADFTFDSFEKQLFNSSTGDDVFSSFKERIKQLTKEERIGTASSYQCALNSLTQFKSVKKLSFLSVTPDFLRGYEQWMIGNGKSSTTVGIYLRPLRAIFNDAIAAGNLKQEYYPFGKRKYQIPGGRNVKKALRLEEIGKIYNYEPAHESEARARDLWFFSYMCNGINVKDMALLKYSSIQGDKVVFIREKTKRTTRHDQRPIVAALNEIMIQIIERWGNKPVVQNEFIFPLLSKGLSAEKERARIQQATKDLNKYIGRIAKAVGIEQKVTTYAARHSFATVLKLSGVSPAEISEAIGHMSLKTTENYLGDFEDEVRRKHSNMLISFKGKAIK